jgi:hypothetical protein
MSTVVNETETEVTSSEAFEIFAALFAKRKKLPNIGFVFSPTGEMLLYRRKTNPSYVAPQIKSMGSCVSVGDWGLGHIDERPALP